VIAEPLPGSFAEKASEPDAPAPAGAPAAAFPCQYRNNSTNKGGKTLVVADGWQGRIDRQEGPGYAKKLSRCGNRLTWQPARSARPATRFEVTLRTS